ncbi:MAG: hypothetical protein JRN58_00070 [Nitrososphaerota archaeon]|jgi:hypothetical protein|nr:hypothetical protein [Nitrososphaerota archaeon]MDG6977468.1 hypothetical protein [Nitrososphaerota archaeon]
MSDTEDGIIFVLGSALFLCIIEASPLIVVVANALGLAAFTSAFARLMKPNRSRKPSTPSKNIFSVLELLQDVEAIPNVHALCSSMT